MIRSLPRRRRSRPASLRAAAIALLLGLGAVALGSAPSAVAQTIDLVTGTGPDGGAAPIEVVADNGIEWLQEEKRFIARGNAVATKGDTQVLGDVLIADYREIPDAQGGGTEIYRLTAEGSVIIRSPQETATGTRAVYEVDEALARLWGAPARLETPTDTVTAEDELRYYERDRKAVATGGAVATRGERRIQADTLTGFFIDPEAGADGAPAKPAASGRDAVADSELDRIYADGAVRITTAQEVAEAERGNYNAKTGIVELEGSVKITRDKNVLTGNRATTDLNTGVSTLHGDGGGRARGLIVPKSRDSQ